MFLELIAVVFAGIGAAGLAMLVNRMTGGRLPRWLAPVAAGAVMIGVTIASEYGWYDRTLDGLPEGFVVVETAEARSYWRPWTQAFPFVERFAAVDVTSLQTHAGQPGHRMADLYFFGRWAPVNRITVLVDCPGARRAALADGIDFAEDGTVEGAEWFTAGDADPVIKTICEVS